MNNRHWRCDGESVRGASHERTGIGNQDALHYEAIAVGQEHWLLLIASDGHGGQAYFRSHLGSRYAVESAAIVLKQWALTADRDRIAELPPAIVHQWQQRVSDHLHQQAFTEQEWQLGRDEPWQGQRSMLKLQQDPKIAYGATLLLTLVTPQFALYLQLGDGDILWVDRTGKTQPALPKDDRQMGNQTLSLCTPNAWQQMQWAIVPHTAASWPALILVATDGYANSYTSDAHFFKIGSDYLKTIRQNGFDKVIAQLRQILTETSRRGSGDDVTLGILYLEATTASTVIQQPPDPPPPVPPKIRRWHWLGIPIAAVLLGGTAIAGYFLSTARSPTPASAVPSPSPTQQVKPKPSPKPAVPKKPAKPESDFPDD